MDLPREQSLRWIVSSYAGLHARHGDGIGTPDLVQPTGKYFPDEFAPTPEGIARLVVRTLEYAPVKAGLDVALRFVSDEGAEDGGCGTAKSCGSGACGTGASANENESASTRKVEDRVLETDTGYLLELPVASVGHPVALTTTIARAVGGIVLREAGEEVTAAEEGGMSELTAIACGFGVLMVSGAHVYGKSCGGARVARHTHLALEEIAVALALFAAHHDVRASVVKEHLETTQREAFAEACDWVESNPTIVTQLRTRPEVLEAGMFRCEETKGFFGKLFARRAAKEEERAFGFAPVRRNS